jgi:hypothetical protein
MKKSNNISTDTKPAPVMTPLLALVIGVAGAAVGCAGILVYGDISKSYQLAVEIEENRAERELVTTIRREISRAAARVRAERDLTSIVEGTAVEHNRRLIELLIARLNLVENKLELETLHEEVDTGCSRC